MLYFSARSEKHPDAIAILSVRLSVCHTGDSRLRSSYSCAPHDGVMFLVLRPNIAIKCSGIHPERLIESNNLNQYTAITPKHRKIRYQSVSFTINQSVDQSVNF